MRRGYWMAFEIDWLIYAMVYLGAALMVYNIYGFVKFARYVKGLKNWGTQNGILYLPIVLLVFFLIGYLFVGVFGNPDLMMAAILFFGSIFVFVMYKFLNSTVQRIVEAERLEAELIAAEVSNEAKSSFLASISHEMRTPLNVILGMDNLALKSPDVPADVRDRLKKIEMSAKYLLGLINNILDMNSIEAGLFVSRHEEFSIQEMLDEVDAIAQALCEEKGLDFEMIVAEQNDCHFIGDEMQIMRVLLSVLDNAVKYTEVPGKVSLAVEYASGDERIKTVRFTIADTGVGMDADFVPQVFSAFSKEDGGITEQYGGGGLSLAVVKNIVELMGGTIEVESEKGVGSTFFITLALVYMESKKVEAESPASQPLESLEGLRILIVEDLPENAEIVADLLELEGAESEHAENGQIALDMVEQSPEFYYDAILMDLRMPVMDGLEATRRIRALQRVDAKIVPIIALTANAFEEDVKQSLEAGMNVHLAKPTDADKLYETVKHLVRKASETERGDLE